jgi:hypothetical protein
MGHYAVWLVFINTSSGACTLQGYPKVSFARTAGQPINNPAPRDTYPTSPRPALVTLAPQASAHASLMILQVDNL